MEEALLTTTEAAERLGITPMRVRQLIRAGRLPSQQFGRDHLIKESDLTLVAERKPGRPKAQAKPAAPAIIAAELKTGDVVKIKPARQRVSKKKK
jgi:excisionase family DNA binding protein